MFCSCPYEVQKTFEKISHSVSWPIKANGQLYTQNLEFDVCPIHGLNHCYGSHKLVEHASKCDKIFLDDHTCINLHAHTRWSDGSGTISSMAQVAKERGMPALVISDHDYMLMVNRGMNVDMIFTSPVRNAELGKEKYLKACNEAERLSKELDFPIIVGIEASMYRIEEALLFGKEAILEFFDERGWLMAQAEDGIFEYPRFRKKKHALIIVHPSPMNPRRPNVQLGLYKMAHGFEVVNSGHLWGMQEIQRMKELCPNGTPFFNIDAHDTSSLRDYYCNPIPKSVRIQNEDDLIDWIVNRKVEWSY